MKHKINFKAGASALFFAVLLFCNNNLQAQNYTLYGIIGDYLVTIDPTTGKAEEVALLNIANYTNIVGLTYVPQQNKLYAVANHTDPLLINIAPCKGEVTEVGAIDEKNPDEDIRLIESIQYNPDDGLLYAGGALTNPSSNNYLSDRLMTVDPLTGDATHISLISGTYQGGDADNLGFGTGVHYIIDGQGVGTVTELSTFNISNGVATPIANTPSTDPYQGMAVHPLSGDIYVFSSNDTGLSLLSSTDASLSLIGTTHQSTEFGGGFGRRLAFAPENICEAPCPYAITTDTTYCNELINCGNQPKICIPLVSTDTIAEGIIGLDFCLNYDESLMSPTGIVSLGNVVLDGSTEADYFINYVTNPGEVHVSVYYNSQAAIGAAFEGIGEIACVEFLLNSNFVAGTTADFEICGDILESYALDVYEACGDAGSFTLENDDIVEGNLLFWNDNDRPLRYDASNSLDYVMTSISGTDDTYEDLGTPSVTPDLNGYFEYDINNGTHLNFNRDILGGGTGGICTDVMPVINGYDCYWTSLVTTMNNSWLPNPFQMIAMDVNMDGYVSGGDITHIQNRIIQNTCEYPQEWNYPNPVELSKDWLFVDRFALDNDPNFTASINYPAPDGQGYERTQVPDADECIALQVTDLHGYCSYIDSMTYHGILLGDANGSWDANTTPVALKLDGTNKVVFDLNAAQTTACQIKIPVRYEGSNALLALDFTLDYEESKLEFVEIESLLSPQTIGMAWNDQANESLRFTSYAKQQGGISSSSPVFYLVFNLLEDIEETDLGLATSFFNGQLISTEITTNQATCTILSNEEIVDNEHVLAIYPSIFSEQLTVDLTRYKDEVSILALYDALGRQLKTVRLPLSKEIITLQVADLPAGVYFLQVNEVTRKVVKP